jgi:hypothetical protein
MEQECGNRAHAACAAVARAWRASCRRASDCVALAGPDDDAYGKRADGRLPSSFGKAARAARLARSGRMTEAAVRSAFFPPRRNQWNEEIGTIK